MNLFTKKGFDPVLAAIIFLGLLSLGILIYTHTASEHIQDAQNILSTKPRLASNNLSRGHLWLEEYLTGDTTIDIEEVLALFDKAEVLIEEISQSKKVAHSTELNENLNHLKKLIAKLRKITNKRVTEIDVSGIGTEIDQQFDAVFKQIQNEFNAINEYSDQHIAEEIKKEQILHRAILVLWVVILVGVLALVTRHSRKRKKTEEELRLSQFTLDHAPDAVYWMDSNGRFLHVNETACRTLGYSREELLSMGVADIDPNLTDGVPPEMAQATKKAGLVRLETEHRTKDGHIFPCEVTVAYIEYKGKEYHCSFVRDITERKRAEEELKESERNHKKAQAITHLGHWNYNPETGLVEGSDELLTIFDFSPGSVLSLESFVDVMHPDDREVVMSAIQKSIENGEPYDITYRLLLDGGVLKWVHAIGESVLDESGKVKQLIGTLLDITERKKAEEELKKYRDHLEGLVEEQTKDIRAAKEEAETANKAKSEFLNNMSHELRTPLHQILGFADLGIFRADDISKEKQLSYFSNIKDSGYAMLQLVEDLMDISKLDAGRMVFNMQENDIIEVVKAESMRVEQKLKERSLTLDVIEPKINTTAIFDAKRIRQVVDNLFSNAIKFSPEGKTMTVSFVAESLPSGDGSPKSIPAIALTVRDEGVGIPEDELETIFDKFTLSSNTEIGTGGRGLGLAICKEIVTAHNGTITAENHPDGGAVFKIILPIEPVR